MRPKNRDFRDSIGILSGKPHSTEPYISWSLARYRGCRGFISISGGKTKHVYKCLFRSLVKTFLTDQKNPLNPENPDTPDWLLSPTGN